MSRIVTVCGKPRHIRGWRPDSPDPRDRSLAVPAGEPLPPLVDLRAQCGPVVDQEYVGSCTANATASAMTFLGKRENKTDLFSRLFIYAMTRKIEGTPLFEDSGSEIRNAMKSLSTYGVPYEVDWPYIAARYSVSPPETVLRRAKEHRALMYYRCPNLYTMKASLFQGFPVVIGFAVPDNMMSDECAKTGIVMPPKPGESFSGGHAVLAVGYNDDFEYEHEKGAVLCQNSWGTEWGQQGFFWIPASFWSGGLGALATDCWTLRRANT